MNCDSEKIRRLENSLMGKISEIEHRDNTFKGHITISKPLVFSPQILPEYNERNIGYTIKSNIDDNLNIENDVKTSITNITLPCPGVYFVRYRLELNISLGISCLKSSCITIETSSNLLLENINTIVNNNNQMITTSIDTFIYTANETELTLFLYIKCNFGRGINTGNLTVVKNEVLPVLTVTRIA